jgi:hypothetical protein
MSLLIQRLTCQEVWARGGFEERLNPRVCCDELNQSNVDESRDRNKKAGCFGSRSRDREAAWSSRVSLHCPRQVETGTGGEEANEVPILFDWRDKDLLRFCEQGMPTHKAMDIEKVVT